MNEFRPLIEAEARQRRQDRLTAAGRLAPAPRTLRRHRFGRALRAGTERLDS